MIKINRGGVQRITTEKMFKEKFKAQGYVIADEPKEEPKEDDTKLEELTNKELRKMLEEKDLPTYGAKAELIERLGE